MLAGLEKEKDLQPLNTLAVPSVAEYFIRIDSVDMLSNAIAWAKDHQLDTHILSGGSNLLLAPFISGLVIQVGLKGVKVHKGEQLGRAKVTMAAGESWHDMVTYCVENALFGIENLALIPGLVGAAPVQNIGAYGLELDHVFEHLTAWDMEQGCEVILSKKQCDFGYRDSVFKHRAGKHYVITSVTLNLSLHDQPQYHYPALSQALEKVSQPTAKDVYRAVIDVRSSKLPDPKKTPNAGSFFKNPVVSRNVYTRIQQKYASVPVYEVDAEHVKIPAAWLIDQAGWKGKTYDGITMHAHQALVLTNALALSLDSVMACANAVREDVLRLFNVQLEIEPQGFL